MQGTYYIFLSNIHDESENDWVYVIYCYWINFSLKCTMLFESLLLLRTFVVGSSVTLLSFYSACIFSTSFVTEN